MAQGFSAVPSPRTSCLSLVCLSYAQPILLFHGRCPQLHPHPGGVPGSHQKHSASELKPSPKGDREISQEAQLSSPCGPRLTLVNTTWLLNISPRGPGGHRSSYALSANLLGFCFLACFVFIITSQKLSIQRV